MKTIIRPPQQYDFTDLEDHDYRVFMAGTIDNGAVVPWVDRIVESLDIDSSVQFIDPRRPDWNSTLANTADCADFREQVEWEMKGLASSTYIVFNILPGSISPVTMLELGWIASSRHHTDVFVCCPDGFWRKGNVDIFCKYHNINVFGDEESLIAALQKRLR